MHNLNRLTILGNVGNDPDTRAVGEQRVATFSVATTERWKDNMGRAQERTEWHRVVCWGGLAKIADEYVRKGVAVYVEGPLRYRRWTDGEGRERFSAELTAEKLKLLTPRGDA